MKIPKDSPETGWGLHDNWSESRTFQREHRKGVSEVDNEQMQFARCRILKNGWLVMIYAEPIPYDEQPDWAGLIDCGQVGRTSKGKIVAYDFALGEHREDHRFSCPALESAHSR